MILGMTYYDFFVPLGALGLAGVGVLYVHLLSRRLEARIAAEKHPAE